MLSVSACFVSWASILAQVSQATSTRLSLMESKNPTGRPAMGICHPRCDPLHRRGNLDLQRWLHWPSTNGRGKDLTGRKRTVKNIEKWKGPVGIPNWIVPSGLGSNWWVPVLPHELSDESYVIHYTLPISRMPANVPWSIVNPLFFRK